MKVKNLFCLMSRYLYITLLQPIKHIIMKADDFNYNDYEELISALKIANPLESILNPEKDEILKFFEDNKEVDYNTFLTLFKEKYGNIIKQYRESQKIKAIKTIKVAAILYIITFILGVIGFIVYLVQ